MPTYTMTETETQGWDNEDAAERDVCRRLVRDMARAKAERYGRGSQVEIRSADGITMDVVEA